MRGHPATSISSPFLFTPLLMQLKMASGTTTPTINTAAQGFLDFVNASPTPFHAVAQAVKRLEDAGFVSAVFSVVA